MCMKSGIQTHAEPKTDNWISYFFFSCAHEMVKKKQLRQSWYETKTVLDFDTRDHYSFTVYDWESIMVSFHTLTTAVSDQKMLSFFWIAIFFQEFLKAQKKKIMLWPLIQASGQKVLICHCWQQIMYYSTYISCCVWSGFCLAGPKSAYAPKCQSISINAILSKCDFLF